MNAQTKPPRREGMARRVLWMAVGAGVLAGGAARLIQAVHGATPAWALAAIAAVLAVLCAWTSIAYWRHLDEAAREAHKFAWLWGGSGALLLLLPALPFLASPRLEAWFGVHSPRDWLMHGVLGVLLLQCLGYGAAWAGWWLVRRR